MAPQVKITHAIFDLDGLILDTERRYTVAYEKVCRQYGKQFSDELRVNTIGVPFLETAQIIVDALNLPVTAVEFDNQFNAAKGPQESIPMPGAERLIRHLHACGIPLAIATGSDRDSFAWKSEPHPQLFALFSHVVNVPNDPEVKRGKPHPDPFLVCASRFTNPPTDMSTVIVFEDAAAGIAAANAAGMQSIWVPDPSTPERPDVKPTQRLRTLEQFNPQDFGIAPFSQHSL